MIRTQELGHNVGVQQASDGQISLMVIRDGKFHAVETIDDLGALHLIQELTRCLEASCRRGGDTA